MSFLSGATATWKHDPKGCWLPGVAPGETAATAIACGNAAKTKGPAICPVVTPANVAPAQKGR